MDQSLKLEPNLQMQNVKEKCFTRVLSGKNGDVGNDLKLKLEFCPNLR